MGSDLIQVENLDVSLELGKSSLRAEQYVQRENDGSQQGGDAGYDSGFNIRSCFVTLRVRGL